MSDQPTYRTAADTARRLGVTVRALRVYERHGLLKPGRTQAGWRVYGPDEFARLHQVLALKRLGLPLAQIAALMKGRTHDLDRILALQEADLAQRKTRVDRALELVRKARARLARGETLPTDDLIQLTKETAMSDFKWTPEHQALAEKHYTPEQLAGLKQREFTPADQETVGRQWAELIAEAERLKDGDPGSPEAQDLARRWSALAGQFTRGDTGLGASAASMYQDAFADPEKAKLMPFSKAVWDFMAEAQRRLKG
jgi:DNA-binding transcriptional MerR regulator